MRWLCLLLSGALLAGGLLAQKSVLTHDDPNRYTRDWRYDDMLKQQTELHDDDEQFIRETIHHQAPNHWFVSVRSAKLKPVFEDVRTRTAVYGALTPTTNKVTFNKTPKEVALTVGYASENWTSGLLLVRPRTVRYNSSPVLTSTLTYDWDSKIGRVVALGYLEYDVIHIGRAALFLDAGLGPQVTLERTIRSSGATGTASHRRIGLAARAGFGAKLQVWRRFSVQAGHGTYLFTPTLMGPVEQEQRLRLRADKVGMGGSYLALIYRFY